MAELTAVTINLAFEDGGPEGLTAQTVALGTAAPSIIIGVGYQELEEGAGLVFDMLTGGLSRPEITKILGLLYNAFKDNPGTVPEEQEVAND